MAEPVYSRPDENGKPWVWKPQPSWQPQKGDSARDRVRKERGNRAAGESWVRSGQSSGQSEEQRMVDARDRAAAASSGQAAMWRAATEQSSSRGGDSDWRPWPEERERMTRMAGTIWGPPSQDGKYHPTPIDRTRAERGRAWLKGRIKSIRENPNLPSNKDGNPAEN